MDKVNQILNFIGDNSAEEAHETEKQDEEHEVEQAPAPPAGIQQEAPQETTKEDYNRLNRQFKKIKEYPTIIKINGKNTIINTEEELNTLKQQLQQEHKEQLKRERRERINKTSLKLNKISDESDTIEDNDDDTIIYKRPKDIYAIKKDGQKLKVPRTSPQDTKRIYKKVSQNKDNLKKLVKAENNEEFNAITEEALQDDNELKETVFNHTHNDINKDKTWDKETLIKLLYNEMKRQKQEKKAQKQNEPNRIEETRTQHGFNLSLFKH